MGELIWEKVNASLYGEVPSVLCACSRVDSVIFSTRVVGVRVV